jgi:hypothetical protein
MKDFEIELHQDISEIFGNIALMIKNVEGLAK